MKNKMKENESAEINKEKHCKTNVFFLCLFIGKIIWFHCLEQLLQLYCVIIEFSYFNFYLNTLIVSYI